MDVLDNITVPVDPKESPRVECACLAASSSFYMHHATSVDELHDDECNDERWYNTLPEDRNGELEPPTSDAACLGEGCMLRLSNEFMTQGGKVVTAANLT